MTEFRTLTSEGLQVGEEFVSETFLVTAETIEPARSPRSAPRAE